MILSCWPFTVKANLKVFIEDHFHISALKAHHTLKKKSNITKGAFEYHFGEILKSLQYLKCGV